MSKAIHVLFLIMLAHIADAQYAYHGRVFKEATGQYMTSGDVLVPLGKSRESRKGTKVAEVDSLGYFSVTLKDSADVRFYIDCSLEGYAIKTVSWRDTLIQFNIGVVCTNYSRERAINDIKNNQPHLLFYGSLTDFPLSKQDQAFQAKYGITYDIFTDQPEWLDCVRMYNREIARFLDDKFGKEWRREVRYEVLSLL